MQSQSEWANILKVLRETDPVLLGVVSNIQTVFTHETITIIATNKGVFDILNKNADKLGGAIIKMKKQEKAGLTLEQKLRGLFGDKLKIE